MAGNYTLNNSELLIDGTEVLSTYDCFVEKSDGFLGLPARKKTLENEWPDVSGIDPDLAVNVIDKRKCNLSLIVRGSDVNDINSNLAGIIALVNKSGYRYLKKNQVPGVFLVYTEGDISVEKLNKAATGKQLARMRINFIEPYTLKKQYYSDQEPLAQVTLVIVTSGYITVDWGDGDTDSISANDTLIHNYSSTGHYCIVIYGQVEKITSVTPTNAVAI